ncbi:RagB/SusD family nutrient uptake outer membrane protein [Pedobacter sp. P351]|uniref:RagB/SusD family nutrient uptake outer membrane protein n=1 Tax=Pedobacter superstes TaxID=3133441 RepID=UPI0030A783C0
MKIYFNRSKLRKLMLVSLASILLTTFSCNFLEVEPKDVINDKDFLNNFWDAQFMLSGTYQTLQPIVGQEFILGEVRADWVKPGTGADKDITELAEHRISSTNKYTDWSIYYDLINRANYAIENVPRVPKDANYFTNAVMKQYIGELKFLRALGYFYLVRSFGDVPLIMETVDDVSKVKYVGATPQDVVLDSIEADLLEAYQYTDVVINVVNTFDAGVRESPEQTRLRATKGTVCALQAEVYLWQNKYAEAAAACQNFYNTGRYNNGPLNSGEQWISLFYNTNPFNEPMFDVNFTYASREISPLMMFTSNDPASGGKYMVAPSDVAIKSYNPSYPIIRTTNTTDEIYRGFGSSYVGSAPYYNRVTSAPVIWKFLALGRVAPATLDVPAPVREPYQSEAIWHVYRQGDLYLMWAEALNRLGQKGLAIQRINSIRNRAGVVAADAATNPFRITTASSAEQIEDVILREFGLELGFEGRRWYTLMRMAKHRGSPQVIIDAVKRRAPVVLHPHLETTLADSKNWYLPYNANELRLNPNLKPKF